MHAVITTEHRGVFAGQVESTSEDGKTVTLTDARMCVYWSQMTHGVLGLAADGPNAECRVGPKVPSIELRGVTATIKMTDEAVLAWDKEPWK